MNNKTKIVIANILRTILTVIIIALDIFLLVRFDYLNNLMAVDNILGSLPLSLILLFSVAGCLLIWVKFKKERMPFSIVMAGWMIVSVALFPNSLTKNWFRGEEVKSVGSDGEVEPYAPFKTDTKAAKLDSPASIKIMDDMPIMDGALALYPVYSAVAQSIYDESHYTDEVRFTNTIRGFNGLVDGTVDIFFSAKPSASQYEYAKSKGKEIYLTPIGLEAFVFMVPKSNPINDITIQQIKNIYSGKTDFWQTLGWKEGGKIIKFQRPEGSGSQTLLQYVMGDLPIEKPQPAPNMDIIGTNSLMKQMTVEYRGVQPALGYSFKFFASVMNPNPDVKFLSLNGVAPTSENISNGTYKYATPFYAMTVGEPKGNSKKVIDWIVSSEGQSLIEKSGYSKRSV